MRLRSLKLQRVRIPSARLDLAFEAGEEIRTEISCKYTRESFAALLPGTGLALDHWYTDPENLFALAPAWPPRRRATGPMSEFPADLRDRLEAAWQRSDLILGLLTRDAWLERPIALRQPLIFYLGHLPAFAWNQVWRGVLGRPSFNADSTACSSAALTRWARATSPRM